MGFTYSLTLLGLLFILLGGSIWIGVSLFIVGFTGITAFTILPAHNIMASIVWNNINSTGLMALPLFIFMGEILVRSKISDNLFKGLAPWMGRFPGGLLHVNTVASAFFAAVSGSVAATTATVGKITIPEFKRRNYSDKLSIGSLASAGTLGIMIPPSMPMLIYGIISDVSIGQLFIGGIIPGLILMVAFSGYMIIRCIINPSLAPRGEEKYTWKDRMQGVPQLAPVLILIAIVLGSIYTGWATPTEAAAVGVVGSIFFALLTKSLDWQIFKEALKGAVNTSGMIILIVCGAAYFSVAVGYLGIPRSLSNYIEVLGLSRYTLIIILSLFYLVLGCLVDGFSMIVMSVPITLPLAVTAGFDPLWFGIYLVVMVQLAQITPPVGFNLFVINGISEFDIWTIAKSALPFFIIMLIFVVCLTMFPELVTYLPELMVK